VFITQGELARNHQQMCVGSRRLPPPTAWRRLRQSISGELPKAEFNLDQIQEVVARRGPGAIDDLIAPGLDWAVPRLFIIDDASPRPARSAYPLGVPSWTETRPSRGVQGPLPGKSLSGR
jgi:hypothetical protein